MFIKKERIDFAVQLSFFFLFILTFVLFGFFFLMFSLKIKFGTYFSFLQRAANLKSSLLNNVNKIPIRNLSINILVSGAKLEKFAVQYAQYHWGLRNNSKAEMSIEMDEVGKRFLVRVRGPPGGGGGKLKKVFHWEYPPPGTWSSFS